VNQLLATAALATQNVTVRATSQTLSFKGTGTITLSGVSTAGPLVGTGADNRVSLVFTPTAGTLTLTVSGSVVDADLRETNVGNNLPVYQRVNTATDYDYVGFPKYFRADGVDDFDLTASIDFTGTDRVTVVAGIRKLSDAAASIFAELSASSASNNGTFHVSAPAGVNPTYGLRSKGTLTADLFTPSSFAAPITNVVSGDGNISGDSAAVRVDGAVSVTSASDQGTGNFGNYPMYFYRRGGTSLPFVGHDYGILINGRSTGLTDSERKLYEAYIANNSQTLIV